jgi:hypothetical protein
MFYGVNRLGFGFLQPDRGYKKTAIVFYDPLTNGPGGDTNYYASGAIDPALDIYPVIAEREAALGYDSILISSYEELLTYNLFDYTHLWDIGYASPYDTNMFNPTNRLYQYLQYGGAMFLIGENSNFGVRDSSIEDFIANLGGGSIERSNTDYSRTSIEVTVDSQFLLANENNRVTFARPGTFTSIGNGTPITTPFINSEYVAVMWKTGSLNSANAGAIISVLDVNVFVNRFKNLDFIDNMLLSMNRL